MKRKLILVAVFLLVLPGMFSLECAAQSQHEASSDEYKVYEAVLGLMDQMPKQNPHITIFDITLNAQCGDDSSPLPLANGCTFFWLKPDSAKDVQRRLRDEWTDMDVATWRDFEQKNAASVRLHDPLATPWRHRFVGTGEKPSEEWTSPDLTIFLSRVGFNANKTEAIVYVLIFSYMDEVATAGDYFLFRVDKIGKWTPNGRITYFSMNKD